MNNVYIERTPWHDNGFAEQPTEKTADGAEPIYRASGGVSGPLGNCFFVPAVGDVPINHWTAEMLELELNAALWGNDFRRITKYFMVPGVRYQIGPIAHDMYAGFEKMGNVITPFYQRCFFTPSGIFKQVRFVLADKQTLEECVLPCRRSFDIKSGNYHRIGASRFQ